MFRLMPVMASVRWSVSQGSVLFIAMSEMAETPEAHLLHDVAHIRDVLLNALLGVERQLPHLIQEDGVLQSERFALEVFFGSLEQRCS